MGKRSIPCSRYYCTPVVFKVEVVAPSGVIKINNKKEIEQNSEYTLLYRTIYTSF